MPWLDSVFFLEAGTRLKKTPRLWAILKQKNGPLRDSWGGWLRGASALPHNSSGITIWKYIQIEWCSWNSIAPPKIGSISQNCKILKQISENVWIIHWSPAIWLILNFSQFRQSIWKKKKKIWPPFKIPWKSYRKITDSGKRLLNWVNY